MSTTTGTVMPSPYQTVLDTAGHPVPGALIWTYLAGTSTPQATYTEASLATVNTNPVVADSAGRFVAFLPPQTSYKFIYETAAVPPAHGTLIKTVDLVAAMPGSGGSGGGVQSILDAASGSISIWSPSGLTADSLVLWTGTTDVTIDGFPTTFTDGSVIPDGALLRVKNMGLGGVMYFRHKIGSGGNRLANFVSSGPTPVAQLGSALWIYQANSSWNLVEHEQGTMITPPYNAANFSAPSGSWVVEASDVVTNLYTVRGRQLFVHLFVNTATLASAPGSLYVATLYSFSADSYTAGFMNDGAATVPCLVRAVVSQPLIAVTKLDNSPFGTVTNASFLMFMLPGAGIV